jgi:hypothetical protein
VLGGAAVAEAAVQPAGVDQPSMNSKTARRSPSRVGHGRGSTTSLFKVANQLSDTAFASIA